MGVVHVVQRVKIAVVMVNVVRMDATKTVMVVMKNVSTDILKTVIVVPVPNALLVVDRKELPLVVPIIIYRSAIRRPVHAVSVVT